MATLGNRIRKIRSHLGLSQSELAARINIDQQSVSRLENGRVNPTIKFLEKIALGLGVSLQEIVAIDTEEPIEEGRTKIVVIDDNNDVREAICSYFNQYDHVVTVGVAENACSGIQLINRVRPDVAILDISMPGCDGLKFLEKLKDCNLTVTCIVYSGCDKELYEEKALDLGAKAFISKSEPLDKLMNSINMMVNKA